MGLPRKKYVVDQLAWQHPFDSTKILRRGDHIYLTEEEAKLPLKEGRISFIKKDSNEPKKSVASKVMGEAKNIIDKITK